MKIHQIGIERSCHETVNEQVYFVLALRYLRAHAAHSATTLAIVFVW
jgi:hypothetical protein